jgi:hypothetical protein
LGAPKSVVIPSTVLEIGESAFDYISTLEDVGFEEGVERIKSSAFRYCEGLKAVALPASLVVIAEYAFASCEGLREVTFAADSKLQSIGKEAFRECPLEAVLLPASVTEIDPSSFSPEAWPIVKFEGPVPFLVNGNFLCSRDSRTMLGYMSDNATVEVPTHIEVIGKDPFHGFRSCKLMTVIFASGSRLREIGERAFCSSSLSAITVPSSVEILCDRCFEHCRELATVTFEEPSKLKKIGERAFALSIIQQFTIPASTDEIDGSAFAGCPLEEIDIDPGNQRFIIRENTLLTSDGTEIVKPLGLRREIFVPSEVEVLHGSCFESMEPLRELTFESGSKLKRICGSALSGSVSLRMIVLPASLVEIEEFAFEDCIGLEECSIHRNAILVKIGREAFARCFCLRSFYVPKTLEGMGENCFEHCSSLSRLKFGSGDTLKKIVRARTLDEALEHLGFTEISSLFRIEAEDDVTDLSFPGWISVANEGSHLTLARDFS